MSEVLIYKCDVSDDVIKKSVDGEIVKEKDGVINFEVLGDEKVDLCPSCLTELREAVSNWFPEREM